MGHEDFGREIREGSAATFRLIREGRTPEEFEQTEASGNVYYVLALTTRGELLESYVMDDNRGGGYYPGFARVVSGDVVMGPVPEEYRETLKGALRSTVDPEVTDTADNSRAVKDTAEASSSGEGEKQAESTEAVSGSSGSSTFWYDLFFGWWAVAVLSIGGALFLLIIFANNKISGSPAGEVFPFDVSFEKDDEEDLSEKSGQFLQHEAQRTSSSSGEPSSPVTPLGERVSNLEDHFPEEPS